jgi:hypothetical protein
MNSIDINRLLELSGVNQLNEDLNTMWEKGFKKKMPKKDFLNIVSADPTARPDRPGKYFKEFLDLYKNKKINAKDKELGGKFNNIVTTIDSDEIFSNKAAWLLNLFAEGNLRDEDMYKAKEYITKYEDKKSEIGKTIKDFKTLPDLYNAVRIYDEDKPEEETISKRQEMLKIKSQAKKVYQDEDWLIVIPETEAASCYYGKGTQWCTAATDSSNAFDDYNSRGELHIVINRKDNDSEGRQIKYQFHFADQEFMNPDNSPINKSDVYDSLSIGARKYFIDMYYSKKNIRTRKGKRYVKISGDADDFAEGFPSNLQNFVENMLKGDAYDRFFSDYVTPFSDIFAYSLDFDKIGKDSMEIVKKYININLPNWKSEYESLEDAINDSEELEELRDTFRHAHTRAQDHADEGEAYSDIWNSMKERLEFLKWGNDDKLTGYVPLDNNYQALFSPLNHISDLTYHGDPNEPDKPYFSLSEPYNGWRGDVTQEDFNESLSNELYDLNIDEINEGYNRILDLAGVLK